MKEPLPLYAGDKDGVRLADFKKVDPVIESGLVKAGQPTKVFEETEEERVGAEVDLPHEEQIAAMAPVENTTDFENNKDNEDKGRIEGIEKDGIELSENAKKIVENIEKDVIEADRAAANIDRIAEEQKEILKEHLPAEENEYETKPVEAEDLNKETDFPEVNPETAHKDSENIKNDEIKPLAEENHETKEVAPIVDTNKEVSAEVVNQQPSPSLAKNNLGTYEELALQEPLSKDPEIQESEDKNVISPQVEMPAESQVEGSDSTMSEKTPETVQDPEKAAKLASEEAKPVAAVDN
jgi:hypothetical protein